MLLEPQLAVGHGDQLGTDAQEPADREHRLGDPAILPYDEVIDRADALVMVIVDGRADDLAGAPPTMRPLQPSRLDGGRRRSAGSRRGRGGRWGGAAVARGRRVPPARLLKAAITASLKRISALEPPIVPQRKRDLGGSVANFRYRNAGAEATWWHGRTGRVVQRSGSFPRTASLARHCRARRSFPFGQTGAPQTPKLLSRAADGDYLFRLVPRAPHNNWRTASG